MNRNAALLLALLATACADGQPTTDAAPTEPAPMAEHTDETGAEHAHTNRLAKESSPYLLQHQHNPVDWYPWGDEAFEKARQEDKPIFLSIGYSTCHWCHVMERESFEDEATAEILNRDFVAIKVDREERPDIDAIYMAAVQRLTGSGGWPLSAWLFPDGQPFLGGTYFPPDDRFGRPGFKTVLGRVAELWKTRRDDLREQAKRITETVRSGSTPIGGAELTDDILDTVVKQYEAAFDPVEGGFGPAPKFPRAFSVSLLLRQASRGRDAEIRRMVTTSLDKMQLGGIHDHLGGGFHRYSTDREWLVPHFEKMLYDQAILARAYVEAWLVTGDPAYEQTARGIFTYVLRDLADPAGAFHSAEDADSEGVEGKFYVWTLDELTEVLGKEDGAFFASVYGAEEDGNYTDEASGHRPGDNILHLESALDAAHAARLAAAREKLLAVRGRRIRPHLDDKVLTDWNGLMIAAFALGGSALDEPRYLDAARGAADFLLDTMRTDGGLLHRYRKGKKGIHAFLDDYAFLIFGLVELHQATQEPRWLRAARELAVGMKAKFHDAENGAFVLAPLDGEQLVTQTKELYDGAIPSGNSVAAYALGRLGRITGDADLEALGRETLEAWSGTIERYPMGYPVAVAALDFQLGPSREIVIAGAPDDPATQALLGTVRRHFLPRTVVVLHDPGEGGAAARELSPFVAQQKPVDGKPAAYVCENYTCQKPVTSVEELLPLLR